MDSSAPAILLPRVCVPSTPTTLLSIYIVQIVYLSFELECEKNENKQKEAGIGPFFKQVHQMLLNRKLPLRGLLVASCIDYTIPSICSTNIFIF